MSFFVFQSVICLELIKHKKLNMLKQTIKTCLDFQEIGRYPFSTDLPNHYTNENKPKKLFSKAIFAL